MLMTKWADVHMISLLQGQLHSECTCAFSAQCHVLVQGLKTSQALQHQRLFFKLMKWPAIADKSLLMSVSTRTGI